MDWSICGVSFSSCFWVISSFTVIPLLVRRIASSISGESLHFYKNNKSSIAYRSEKRKEEAVCRPFTVKNAPHSFGAFSPCGGRILMQF